MPRDIRTNADLLSVCEKFLQTHPELVAEYIESFPESTVFEVPVERLYNYNTDLAHDFYEHPEQVANHLAKALEIEAIHPDESLEKLRYWDSEEPLDDDGLAEVLQMVAQNTDARCTGFHPSRIYDVGQYAPDDIAGELIHIRGQVTKRSKRKLRDEVIAFECQRCGRLVHMQQTGNTVTKPHDCPGCEKKGPWQENQRQTQMRNYQRIRLQTLPEHAQQGDTEMIDMRVFDDLVGELKPGDRAIINAEMVAEREKQKSRDKELEGRVHAITKLSGDHSDVDIEEYEDDVIQIASGNHPDYATPYEAIFESVSPFHEGDDSVKEAIAYVLFGGIEKDLEDGTWMRGNSHILLMGDPGSGKTAMLKYVQNLVPRSEYATGKSSSAGLTGTAQKDEFADGGWTLQAGTLVKASGGVACIDELDKMYDEETAGFMEALSDQQITVTMVVSGVLPAKTAVIAAANPKYGRFDKDAPIGDQLDLSEVLLSRFDLWFIMRDEPDEDLDESVARTMTTTARIGQKERGNIALTQSEEKQKEPPIPAEMFKAYVAMAKQCFPVFTDDAMDRIVSEYVELRQVNESADGPVPTTHRLVEALHRLSEASARMRLADEVKVEDVERALDVLYESLETLGIDPDSGMLDAQRFTTGTSSTQKDRIKAVTAIITGLEDETEDGAPYDEIRKEATVLMDEDQFEDILDKLKQKREVYEPSRGYYRTT